MTISVFSTLKDAMYVLRVDFDDTNLDFVVVKLGCFLPSCCFLSIPCPFLLTLSWAGRLWLLGSRSQ